MKSYEKGREEGRVAGLKEAAKAAKHPFAVEAILALIPPAPDAEPKGFVNAWDKLVHDFVGHAVNSWQGLDNVANGLPLSMGFAHRVHDSLTKLTDRWTALRAAPHAEREFEGPYEKANHTSAVICPNACEKA